MSWMLDFVMTKVKHTSNLPLHQLKRWQPIKIDALGLVTLLGADEVNKAIGTLQTRRYTEFLPLLAAFIISGDNYTEEQAGFSLYNITDGIHTTELKGWFTRWLSSQETRNGTSIFRWKVEAQPQSFRGYQLFAAALSLIAIAPLLVCTCLMGDWFGLGNSLAIIASVFVRKILLWQLRTGLNSAVTPEEPLSPHELPLHKLTNEKGLQAVDSNIQQLHTANSAPTDDQIVTAFVTRADGRMVTIHAPRTIFLTFFSDIRKPSPLLYDAARWVGWVAFGAHIIVLGMSTLFTQIYTVVLLVLSTVMLCHGFSRDVGRTCTERAALGGLTSEVITTPLTSQLVVEHEKPAVKSEHGEKLDKRMHAYVRVDPTEKQERMMKQWSLLPFDGVPWYETYNKAKEKRARLKAAKPQIGSGAIQTNPIPAPSSTPSAETKDSTTSESS